MKRALLVRLSFVIFLSCVLAGFLTIPQDRGSRPPDVQPEGCTVVMVGKNASADGSVMTTHSADCGVCDWTWRHVPTADR